ncbi:hypothetical protein D3C75_1029840 [compost metagenome]
MTGSRAVHIEGESVPRPDIGPEGGEPAEPALAIRLAAKPEPLPFGGGGAQQIFPFYGSGIGQGEGLWIATRFVAAALAVEGGVIELKPEPAHLPLPDRAQLLPGSGRGLHGSGHKQRQRRQQGASSTPCANGRDLPVHASPSPVPAGY